MSKLSTDVYNSIGDVERTQWNHVVEQSDHGSIYHRTGWIGALEAGLDLHGKHVIVKKNGNPIGVFPNLLRPIRLPDSIRQRLPERVDGRFCELASMRPGFGGPVLTSDEKAALDLALSELDASTGVTVLSHYVSTPSVEYVRYAEHFEAQGYTSNVSRCRPVIDLHREYDAIFNDMHKDRRYNLRKARKNDVEIVTKPPTVETLRTFHDTYRKTMDRIGAEPQPFALFREIVDGLAGNVRLVAAERDGETVGQHLYLLDEPAGTVRHEFSAVSADDFQYYPSELIHEHTIQWGQREGYRTYDFGPTPSNHEDGLFSYKHQYGGTVFPVLTWEQGQSPLWGLYKQARTLYKRYR